MIVNRAEGHQDYYQIDRRSFWRTFLALLRYSKFLLFEKLLRKRVWYVYRHAIRGGATNVFSPRTRGGIIRLFSFFLRCRRVYSRERWHNKRGNDARQAPLLSSSIFSNDVLRRTVLAASRIDRSSSTSEKITPRNRFFLKRRSE